MPLFLLSPLASCTPSPTGLGPTSSAVAKPGLSKLFTGSLQLEKALKPIAIPGGARLGKTISPTFEFKGMKVLIKDGDTVEPVAPNGTISGSGFTWTVTGGTAFPVFYEGMKIERPDIIVYGNTDKNGSFFATLQGVGSPVDQYVRIVSTLPCWSRPNVSVR